MDNIAGLKCILNDISQEKIVFIVPGANGKPLTHELYEMLKEPLAKAGFSFIRVGFWEKADDLNEMTLREIHENISRVIAELRKKYKKVYAIGKSLGAGLLLAKNFNLDGAVLWAPAIGFSDNTNIPEIEDILLENFDSFRHFKIDKDMLSRINYPVCIIQGKKDDVVLPEESEQKASFLKNCKLIYIDDADHSYHNKEKELAEETLKFLCSLQ